MVAQRKPTKKQGDTTKSDELSNPFSTGGGGLNFETRVQASFAVLMLAGGFSPVLPIAPIVRIKLQGKHKGFATDDLIIFTDDLNGNGGARLLGQIKHSISITENDPTFGEVIRSAWADFRNPDVFQEGRDSIALITGPLSATDTQNVRTILEWARHSESAEDFLDKVEKTQFSSKAKRDKLQAFRVQLKEANAGTELQNDELWRFLKCFHLLGYDLDVRSGVTLSLLHSVIGQRAPDNANAIWARLTDEVQYANQNAGSLTRDSISADVRRFFEAPVVKKIPAELEVAEPQATTVGWEEAGFAPALTVANLLGSWDESKEADRAVAAQIAERAYPDWIRDLREVLQLESSPVVLRSGTWTVAPRLELWIALAQRLFDPQLDTFMSCALKALAEADPKFDLDPAERYAASVHGKVLQHSPGLRKGMAESLALLGAGRVDLPNCTVGKAQGIAAHVVGNLLAESDWVRWGSLDPVLPLLAEAAPDQFLDAMEHALQQTPCPFDALFSQEGQGIFGSNYMTGVLWGLETLAWDERHLIRSCLVLAGLATRDPGGQWVNRAANSLTTIFLPWLPQTAGSTEKRRLAIDALVREYPAVGWKLLLSLLPGSTQASSGSRKPEWRTSIPDDWRSEVTQAEYWNQVSTYSDMVVDMAEADSTRIGSLIDHLRGLPAPAFERLLAHLKTDDVVGMPESERRPIWEKLSAFVARHRRYSDADWALPSDVLSKVEDAAEAVMPKDPMHTHRRLFSQRDFDLYEETGDWRKQQEKLEDMRRDAVLEIMEANGVESVLEFAQCTEAPDRVGIALGSIAAVDGSILPHLIESPIEALNRFAAGYVWARHRALGWEWSAQVVSEKWTRTQIGQLIASLPFECEAWAQAAKFLGQEDGEYWNRVQVNPWPTKSDLAPAVEKLLQYGRAAAAIECLSKGLHDDDTTIDPRLAVRALLSAAKSEGQTRAMDVHNTVELIKHLQKAMDLDSDELFRVEWAYLSLLDEHRGASPVSLERRIASSPEFFCELIRLVYRPRDTPPPEKEPSPEAQAIAQNAWRLLHEWKRTPGTADDGKFSGSAFVEWVQAVRKLTEESGHVEVALITVGQVLIHAPADPDGLWIHRDVAGVLDAQDAEEMRRGYNTATMNARGVHWVDPSGAPERKLAAEFRQKADDVENGGFARFAAKLRDLADHHDREAHRITEEHRKDPDGGD